MTQYLTDRDVSRMTGIAVQTLRNWRHERKGFPYSKVGRTVRYDPDDVEDYMKKRRVDPEGLEVTR
jgi:predicted site-specific integrase-resolvase